MKCVTCGKENDSSAKFCGICGTELNSSPEINYELHEYQANDQGMVGFGEAIKLGFVNRSHWYITTLYNVSLVN